MANSADPTDVLAESARGITSLIVGIGGSAGSLNPLREFLAAVPVESGLAFVVVSHQAPTGHSMLPDILAKCTGMPVREISEETIALPNHVYIEPPGHTVKIREGVLIPEPIVSRGVPHLPIDLFFRALARDQESAAVGIVLSGTGTDGTLGLAAIRAASGLSLVQDPETAEFDGMPVSAIQARAADFILSPVEMPTRLLAHRDGLGVRRATPDPEMPRDEIELILKVMRQRGGRDFAEYKQGTLGRRILRRMRLLDIDNAQEYARCLEQNAAEIDALWHDWLIGVSSFFRDPEAFRALESALQEQLAALEDGSPLRIWVCGCATGEEAYSIIILVVELLRHLKLQLEVQMFATDLNPAAIQVARTGTYPEGIAADVGDARLARFFTREDGFYRVRKELRDLVVFAVQDALHDPPFTRVDLVSCRNLLIYLEPSGQRRLLRSFHYSLNPRGLLLLGSSENATGSEEFFSPIEERSRIYRRNDATAPQPTIRWPAVRGEARNVPTLRVRGKSDLAVPLSRALAEHFAPPAVLVDASGQIQQVHGDIGFYLGLQAGRVHVNVVDMARKGLRGPLSSALREASDAEDRVAERTVRLQADGEQHTLHLKVSRLQEPRFATPLFLVSFEAVGADPQPRSRKRVGEEGDARPPADLEDDLRDARRDLQRTIDELQAANEELASANEEAQSANEELQSSNEELQTAKEETQSLNEELHTVNAELTEKIHELENASSDLVNLMSNIEVAAIFLDEQLRVKRFTPQARQVAHLLDADIGRPLADLATHLDYPNLLADAASVVEKLHASETQAVAPDGSWYLVRIRPYRTARNVVEGVVITFFDITDTKRNEQLEAARLLAESIVDAVREPFLVLDGDLRVVRANRAYYDYFEVEPADTDGRLIADLGSHHWIIPGLRERLETAVHDGASFDDFLVEAEFPHLGRRRLLLNARSVWPRSEGNSGLILLGIQEARDPQASASMQPEGASNP